MSHVLRTALAAIVFLFATTTHAAGLWFADEDLLRQVDPATNQITLSVPFKDADDAQALTLDPKDGSLWVLAKKHLHKLDASGAALLKLSLKNLGVDGEAEHATLSLNPYDQSFWLAN